MVSTRDAEAAGFFAASTRFRFRFRFQNVVLILVAIPPTKSEAVNRFRIPGTDHMISLD